MTLTDDRTAPTTADLIDRAAIAELTCRMGVLADQRRWVELADLFTDRVDIDYTSLLGGQPATVTRKDLVTGWAGTLTGLDATQHMISNHQTRVDGDSASCEAYFQATHMLANPHGSSRWALGGQYRFSLLRVDGEWRISAVVMRAVWADGNQNVMALAAAAAAPS